jgi:hypothetical protein
LTPQQQDEYLPLLKTIADPLYRLRRITKKRTSRKRRRLAGRGNKMTEKVNSIPVKTMV